MQPRPEAPPRRHDHAWSRGTPGRAPTAARPAAALLDHNRHVRHELAQIGRQRVESLLDRLVEVDLVRRRASRIGHDESVAPRGKPRARERGGTGSSTPRSSRSPGERDRGEDPYPRDPARQHALPRDETAREWPWSARLSSSSFRRCPREWARCRFGRLAILEACCFVGAAGGVAGAVRMGAGAR